MVGLMFQSEITNIAQVYVCIVESAIYYVNNGKC